jgi:glycosyltransferase involved in cell wall biosynthesis
VERGAVVIRGTDVTVVIPTIPGRDQVLRRAMSSVHAQQVPPHDVRVVIDTERHGAHWARNQALDLVTTDWIAWLDDDDELLPNHIKVLVRGANKSGADLVFTYAEFVGGRDPLAVMRGDGVVVPEPINFPWNADAERSLRVHGNFIPVTYMVKTKAVRAVGGFPVPYSFYAKYSNECEDYGLLLRLLDAGYKFHHVCGVRTWRYNFWDGNVGGRGLDRMHELADHPSEHYGERNDEES